MTTREQTAADLARDIVDVLGEIRSTRGVPDATRDRCENALDSIHQSLHGLNLWLRELLQWAPLASETRSRVMRLATDLGEADARFHPATND